MMSHEPHAGAGAERGIMVVVVGPSGAGKDTLMNLAARRFKGRDDVHFVRRVITRHRDAGGEDHLSVSLQGFAAMEQSGSFAVWWEAHGLKYGIPAEVSVALSKGHVVVANGSRSALHRFQAAFPRLKVINVTASPEVLADRLEARGRETHEDIMARLARGPLTVRGEYDVVELDNSGSLEEAEQKMIEILDGLLAKAP
ncbi:phosphonate metabolism protein/1,5-bisphosphokinase (PRPP-forming) PhnN [Rhizobium laguerreae]|uniref:phosphonate metabolism protein/1,5-bisphosphokinase (PRPP-forming) PhnN n=1 Tax=Rhizobium laguerreae TaxID=1076926 RepID=UPI001C9041DA|nr:phosphonate metabolism protein/1,5-bisphosphokinase (PRPP-forming) PhnN [Rhizobium laguerreae]MBY3345197.1 phosphonate metabolism protein/1,5-bisphosphokinase (PRPP-forming) PhnN [Rhizobium laguerreae]MBY3352969.1 phosphonate metabolism protein/1,5-bisphosphokinase (PRPP-forming) PhnN [Rhizobium laguerreae]MBY3373032.1 phosphonate metabolism protein/1,5-bisphosphokinase (PRPP-forming) PhnN [Rhizobium laguerreae]MBY3428199.1 phosphonate metabolism protein/1,5-bisphosphokinase (PRPP-forming) P